MDRTDREPVRRLLSWFRGAARPLPWRPADPDAPRDPYAVLVSEVMLQQTQASRVAERLPVFLSRFPTTDALARADERDVMALWSGLGYYRRGRNLHAAAREIVARFDGRVPGEPEQLASLPGIGDYTAGAVASLAFGRATPAVDGNVSRVVLRVRGLELAADSPAARSAAREQVAAWMRARPRRSPPGPVNEALMELGATVCTPRAPRCTECPLRTACASHRDGTHHRIPTPKRSAARGVLFCDVVVARDARGRLLVEPRGASGLWAGLWQAPTREHASRCATVRTLRSWLGVGLPLERADRFEHATTHRRVGFTVWRAGTVTAAEARALAGARDGSEWMSRRSAAELPLSTPQRRVLFG